MIASRAASFGSRIGTNCANRRSRHGDKYGRALAPRQRSFASPGCGPDSRDRYRRNELHVVVATIQTLNAKLTNQLGEYEFLTDFKLVAFDEAHRSLAPTFTSVMQEIGLTRRREADEPFLLGLTATPYRGYNEEETAWLVNRYGSNRLDSGALRATILRMSSASYKICRCSHAPITKLSKAACFT